MKQKGPHSSALWRWGVSLCLIGMLLKNNPCITAGIVVLIVEFVGTLFSIIRESIREVFGGGGAD